MTHDALIITFHQVAQIMVRSAVLTLLQALGKPTDMSVVLTSAKAASATIQASNTGSEGLNCTHYRALPYQSWYPLAQTAPLICLSNLGCRLRGRQYAL